MKTLICIVSIWSVGLASCSKAQETVRATSPTINLAVAPLNLPGVGVACYDATVTTATGTVWVQGDPALTLLGHDQALPARATGTSVGSSDASALCSDKYGNSAGGDISYIGPCDASLEADTDPRPGVQNTVTLWVDGLYNATKTAELGEWQDPCPSGCELSIDCAENQDSQVQFNLTVLRQAKQGFFDIAVSFNDIFCSAKFDTCYEGDEQIGLLHGDDGERDWTGVFGFACTAGSGDAVTKLLYSDIAVECGDTTFPIDPTGLPGNNLSTSTSADQLNYGIYRGMEELGCDDPATAEVTESCNKAYWNLAFSLDDLIAVGGTCTLKFDATATDGNTVFGNGLPTGDGVSYPYIDVDATLTTTAGAQCQRNALNDGGAVTTAYRGNLNGLPAPKTMCSQYDGISAAAVPGAICETDTHCPADKPCGDDGDGDCAQATCGLNLRGLADWQCVAGAWTTANCIDPDICTDGNTQTGTTACGLNGRGLVDQRCITGAWSDTDTCVDLDVCADDDICSPAAVEALQGDTASSNFETNAQTQLPTLGWAPVSGVSQAFDLGSNGALIGGSEFEDYAVQYETELTIQPNTTYTLHIDMGFVADAIGGVADYRIELGTTNAGTFTALASDEGTAAYAGNLSLSVVSATSDVVLMTGPSVPAAFLTIRFAQTGQVGLSGYFGIDNVTLSNTCLDATCGLNDRGLAHRQCVAGVWTTTSCVDSDVCTDGATQAGITACGLNGRGLADQECVTGVWSDTDTSHCVDPDTCIDGAVQAGTAACGLNGRGLADQQCVAGVWSDTATCVDPDTCTDDDLCIAPTVSGLRGETPSSHFETNSQSQLPTLGWSIVSGTSQVFDLGSNGALMGGRNYDNYEVQYETGLPLQPNTPYTLRIDMGFVADAPGGFADYRIELGTVDGGTFTALASDTGRVVHAGNLSSGVVSGTSEIVMVTGPSVAGAPLAIRFAQIFRFAGGSEYFGIDNVTLSNDCPDATCGLNSRGLATQQCVAGAWNQTDTCVDPDLCTDGTIDEAATVCGLNGRGLADQQCVAGGWTATDTDTCTDPDICADGAIQAGTTPCGLNSRGLTDQQCVTGAWNDTAVCVDPDTCTDGNIQAGPTACGINGRGRVDQECITGAWSDTPTCVDTDICTDGAVKTGTTACGFNGRGLIERRCVTGVWGDSANCVDPDECADDDIRPEVLLSPLDGTTASSNFETNSRDILPTLGWTNTSSTASVFDLVTNGVLMGDFRFGYYEVEYVTDLAMQPNTSYRVRADLGFVSDTPGGTADFHVEFGTTEGGIYTAWSVGTGTVLYAGNLSQGVVSGTVQIVIITGAVVSGDPITIRLGQASSQGPSDFFAFDNVTLSRADACGLNNRGIRDEQCVAGTWSDGPTCVDPDICTDGVIRAGTTACGLNGRGALDEQCVSGSWSNTATCVDPDTCTDGAIYSDTPIGLLDGTSLLSTFETGSQAPSSSLGWTALEGVAQIFDLGENGALVSGTEQGAYKVQYESGVPIQPNTTYELHLDVGFVSDAPDGLATYNVQLGVVTDYGFSELVGEATYTLYPVVYAGNLSLGVVSRHIVLVLETGPTIYPHPLTIRFQSSTINIHPRGEAGYFGMDNVILRYVATCGFNERGTLYNKQCVMGAWADADTCVDSDICTDGTTQATTDACGLNGRGFTEQLCVTGAWSNAVTCVDPDTCSDGTIQTGTTACGLNGRGLVEQECVTGAWDDTATCVDPDICTDDTTQAGITACGLNGRGLADQKCVIGAWNDTTTCVDPDECVDDDIRTEVLLSPLDGTTASSNFETNSRDTLPTLGWTNTSSSASVFDLETNGVLMGDSPFGSYEVEYATGLAMQPDTSYTLRVDMGFVSAVDGGTADFHVELGTTQGGTYAAWSVETGTVLCVGNLSHGVISGIVQMVVVTGSVVSGDTLTIRLGQATSDGPSDYFAFDNVTLSGAVACGLNNRGIRDEQCVAGTWSDVAACVDPDECIDADMCDVFPGSLDGMTTSSTFDINSQTPLPALGWTERSGGAQVFVLGSNGALTGDSAFEDYEVEYVSDVLVRPNTSYALQIDMGFASDSTGGTAGYRIELGTAKDGTFTPLTSENGTVAYAGNLLVGMVSASSVLSFDTGPSVTGDPLTIRFAQTFQDGTSGFFGIDDIVLNVDCPGTACGLHDNGRYEQQCTLGVWNDTATCLDPDE
jgi:hypothetical protein